MEIIFDFYGIDYNIDICYKYGYICMFIYIFLIVYVYVVVKYIFVKNVN